jgi:hypothetical protein
LKRDILSVTVEPIDPTIARNQKLTACEVAYAALMNSEEPPLRWFTSSLLRLPVTWTPMAAIALWKPAEDGSLAWREARNPFAILRVIARRTAVRWRPELVFGCDADRVHHPRERAVSTLNLRVPEDARWGPDDVLGYFAFHNAASYGDDSPEDDFRFYIIPELCFDTPRDGLYYDWDTIGQRAGLDADEVALLKARFQNYTRTTVGRFLKWDEHKVQAVWRRVNRRLDNEKVLHRLELVLTGHITEPPPKILAA